MLNALYAGRIIELDPMIYNLGDKYFYFKNVKLPREERFDLEWVRRNTAIVHYYGRNKPWKETYLGVLGVFYQHFAREVAELEQKLPPEQTPIKSATFFPPATAAGWGFRTMAGSTLCR